VKEMYNDRYSVMQEILQLKARESACENTVSGAEFKASD
jgi:hypothetical protein